MFGRKLLSLPEFTEIQGFIRFVPYFEASRGTEHTHPTLQAISMVAPTMPHLRGEEKSDICLHQISQVGFTTYHEY